jgi:hypothetical protein
MTVEIQGQVTKPIATRTVANRRELHFDSLEDIWNEAERLAHCDVRLLGNWSLGQIFKHLAEAMHMAIDGASFRVPWYMRAVTRLFKQRILTRPMPSGIRLPREAQRQLMPGETTTEEGLKLLRQAIARLEREEKRSPSPFLGLLSREEFNLLQQRHAELHLSFAVPV